MSSNTMANSGIEQSSLSMVIIRANGEREDLGVVSYYHKNPIKRIMFKIKKFLGITVNSK
jgi:hypothetical protein